MSDQSVMQALHPKYIGVDDKLDFGCDEITGTGYKARIRFDNVIHKDQASPTPDIERAEHMVERIEFFLRLDPMSNQAPLRGAVLFDQADQPLLYLRDAVIGSTGRRVNFLRLILLRLGVPLCVSRDLNARLMGAWYERGGYSVAIFRDGGSWQWVEQA